jgi:hypothetical protein
MCGFSVGGESIVKGLDPSQTRVELDLKEAKTSCNRKCREEMLGVGWAGQSEEDQRWGLLYRLERK